MADPASLSAILGMTPQESVDYLRAKGYAIGWAWWDVWREAHRDAFTAAKIARMDVLEALRAVVDESLAEGWSRETFARRLAEDMTIGGFLRDPESGLSPWRIETIYRTNMQVAYNVGRWRAMSDNAEARPYIQYLTVQDDNVRPAHRALHGKVFHINDPAWSIIHPPNGFNCRCRARALTAAQVASRGLTVESAVGRIEEKTISVGGIDRISRGYVDPVTGEALHPDPGWDYNPGEREADAGDVAAGDDGPIRPNWPRYSRDIAAIGRADRNPWAAVTEQASDAAVAALIERIMASLAVEVDEID